MLVILSKAKDLNAKPTSFGDGREDECVMLVILSKAKDLNTKPTSFGVGFEDSSGIRFINARSAALKD